LPNTTYNYIVRGGSSYTTGSVKTLRRQVDIHFDQIDVIDDSDGVTPGDLTFHFNINGEWKTTPFGEVAGSSGESLYPARVFSFFPTLGTLTLAVQGRDDDCDFGELCSGGLGPDFTSGSNSQADWATAQSEKIDIAPPTSTNSVLKTVTFETRGNALEFKVHTRVRVKYF
jgi:hypothetical protein